MAKKLYVGNYTFDASEQVVSVSGNVAAEKFLIITNISSNTIIYNFADATLGYAGKFYDITSDKTEFSLIYDTTSMNDTDVLQIFVDQDYQEITPAEDLLDPVGKLRVSNPENLIDTDFEYGLQGTKWETLQTVNNIPTIYSNTGDVPVDGITSVDAIVGSKNVKVTTNIPHGLSIGDPISVQGLSQYQAEGFFIITSVPDTLSFFFELDVPANFSGDISGSYTTIIPGKFFEGSTLPVSTADGAVTDAAGVSVITVNTGETHGLTASTKVYLRNTVGPRTLEMADSTATAPDGRPFVDTVANFNSSDTVDISASTGRGNYRDRAVVTYDWESTYTKYLTTSDWNASNNRITWTGHNMRDGYTVLFNTPYYGLSDGGITDGTVAYVDVIDANTIELHTTRTLTSIISLSTLSNLYGLARLGLVYKIEAANGTIRQTEFFKANEASSAGQTSEYKSNSTNTVSFNVDVTTALGGNPTSVSIQDILAGGDINSTTEWLEFTIAGITQRIYGPGNQSWNMLATAQTNGSTPSFNNLDVSSSLTTSGGRTFLPVTVRANTSVGGFTSPNGSDRYRFVFNLINNTPAGSFTEDEKKFSGGDLADTRYGLGNTQPQAVVAFQGRTSGSYSNSNDAFSYLVNQRNNGRYGTLSVKYSQVVTVESNQSGSGAFTIDYNDSNTVYGTGSENFYIFTTPLTSDRNTLYIPNHGITGNQTSTITVNSTDYSNGQRFAYANSSGSVTNMSSSFNVTASAVNQDVIRLQTNVSPNTDDIAKIPEEFVFSYSRANENFNTLFFSNHKITGEVEATYNNVSGTAIPPLTNGQTFFLERKDDSRLRLSDSNTGATGSASIVEQRNSNSVTSIFINLTTALGFDAGTASLTSLDFRGDFSATSEYVELTFPDDGTSFIIGQFDDIGDSATYTTSTTLTGKNLSSILTTNGSGDIGFNVSVDPTSAVNYGPGGGPWWGLRFNVTGEESGVVITGPGTGAHSIDVNNIVGAYDGVFTMTNVPSPNSFTMSSDFQIPNRTYSFTSSGVNVGGGTITFSDTHNLITGEKITYDANGNSSMLPSGTTNTFVIVVNDTTIKLAPSAIDALGNLALTLTNPSGTHILTSNNVIKNIKGAGSTTIVNGTKTIVGSGTRFLTNFKRFDKIYINTGVYVKEFTVDTVTTNEALTIFEIADASNSGADYYYATQLSLRPDGFGIHKPFDGGVDITAGTSPNCRIARQTRKYFRYQSGKGIQTSFAINFNPPKLVRELIKASGTTATVNTQEQHNLKVGDQITISGAETSTGTNTYNGTFPVVTVPDPFSFTYTMSSTPAEVKASGFPRYVRAGWTDSFVRGGMFDDQNGFFFEYDGQKLYAVRRSSTTQLAGSVSCTRGSQVISGLSTSFTTQLDVSDTIVIRGQTYKVVEISSDIRMVVQPAYRGIDATDVKATKTVDTKVAQEDWNMDPADGTGFTGYILDKTKIQMAYMDYSWYGAGKIRYGFKDSVGHIRYFHEFRHNNKLDESYFRSGNLPSRYEIENGPTATTAPTLFHFGTSIIMDGTFDDDKAYQFTGQSKPFAFTAGASNNVSSNNVSTFQQITLDGRRVYVYAIPVAQSDAEATIVGSQIKENAGTDLPAGTYVTQVKVDGANSLIYASYPATSTDPTGGSVYPAIAGSTVFVVGEATEVELSQPLPLISVRLAPSVDSGLTGALGEREVINRMQLRLRQASITSNRDIEFILLQNSLPSAINFQDAQSPSLSEIIKHKAGDTLLNGTAIYSAKASAGSVTVDLDGLLEIGNSMLGGDGIFPAGPDLLTLAVQPQTTSGVTGAAPFTVSGKISWSESQA